MRVFLNEPTVLEEAEMAYPSANVPLRLAGPENSVAPHIALRINTVLFVIKGHYRYLSVLEYKVH